MNRRTTHGRKLRCAAIFAAAAMLGSFMTNDVVGRAAAAEAFWGTYQRPFAVNSLWNSRPVAPVLGTFVIPVSTYQPLVGEGSYSLGVFLAKTTDHSVTVFGFPGTKGVWDPDAEAYRQSITILRWPPEAMPAQGSDGHMDIVDPQSGMVHSFYKLRNESGKWMAQQYAWTRIDGSGWGDPAHYFQGARATGVPSMGGLIRKHEVADGDTQYRHALAVSLTYNALAASPSYVFPATSADGNAVTTNSGSIPEGALLMLPPWFDTAQISSPDLRKVAETLKTYGAYVVDRNTGTPFYIYVENGSGYNLYRSTPASIVIAELDRIRQSLRQVTSTRGWIDARGASFAPQKNLNLLSMRGLWQVQTGAAQGDFDTWSQSVVFPNPWWTRTVLVNYSSRVLTPVAWATPRPNAGMRLMVQALGNAKLQVKIYDKQSKALLFDSGELGDGQAAAFLWPSRPAVPVLYAISGAKGVVSAVRGQIVIAQ